MRVSRGLLFRIFRGSVVTSICSATRSRSQISSSKKPFSTCSASNVRVIRATGGRSAAITLSLPRTMLSPDVTHFVIVTGVLEDALITPRANFNVRCTVGSVECWMSLLKARGAPSAVRSPCPPFQAFLSGKRSAARSSHFFSRDGVAWRTSESEEASESESSSSGSSASASTELSSSSKSIISSTLPLMSRDFALYIGISRSVERSIVWWMPSQRVSFATTVVLAEAKSWARPSLTWKSFCELSNWRHFFTNAAHRLNVFTKPGPSGFRCCDVLVMPRA
mmetsp:Transcript_16623/g.47425  ORF Transcript_16623/g.47425 Transcript_16623/m.47425 type:complete len:280 (-) Transcript_16623:1854-2693(-)